MTILNTDADTEAESFVTETRSLLLVWQNPLSKLYTAVGRLQEHHSVRYSFHYLDHVADIEGFKPISGFPDFSQTYSSANLAAFFANRVMTEDRENYSEYLAWLGLEGTASTELPMEILVRTGGGRATDTFHVVEEPDFEQDKFAIRFFVSGLWHIDPTLELAGSLIVGQRLLIRENFDNEVNPLALFLDVEPDKAVGWVPDWLCGQIQAARVNGYTLRAEVEQVRKDAPPRVRVLCKITASKQEF